MSEMLRFPPSKEILCERLRLFGFVIFESRGKSGTIYMGLPDKRVKLILYTTNNLSVANEFFGTSIEELHLNPQKYHFQSGNLMSVAGIVDGIDHLVSMIHKSILITACDKENEELMISVVDRLGFWNDEIDFHKMEEDVYDGKGQGDGQPDTPA